MTALEQKKMWARQEKQLIGEIIDVIIDAIFSFLDHVTSHHSTNTECVSSELLCFAVLRGAHSGISRISQSKAL